MFHLFSSPLLSTPLLIIDHPAPSMSSLSGSLCSRPQGVSIDCPSVSALHWAEQQAGGPSRVRAIRSVMRREGLGGTGKMPGWQTVGRPPTTCLLCPPLFLSLSLSMSLSLSLPLYLSLTISISLPLSLSLSHSLPLSLPMPLISSPHLFLLEK